MRLIISSGLTIFLFFSASFLTSKEDWPYYGGDLGGSRYSKLAQINTSNVSQLRPVWIYSTQEVKKNAETALISGFQVTPILTPKEAGHSLVICSGFNRIIALDPETGSERWKFDPILKIRPYGVQYKCRGVALWQDKKSSNKKHCTWRIFMNTVDRRLFAVDAKDGQPCKDFGRGGVVDITPLIEAANPGNELTSVQSSSPPVIVKNTVVVGSTVGAKYRRSDAPSGAVRAFDARTGKHLWSFDPLRPEGLDLQHQEISQNNSLVGGANVWTLMSGDEAGDLIFLPTSSPSPNFFGGTRPGNNLFANSIVALRASTGELVWYFQIVHHDVWDYDLPAQPIVTTINQSGKLIPVVVQLTKQGLIFVLHRDTGKPFFPIEERTVPTNGVPGEILSPTQPFPVLPPPLVKQSIEPNDAWGFTPFDKRKCREQIELSRYGEIYTPPSLEGTTMLPSISGGSNWGGGAFDPVQNILITNVMSVPGFIKIIPQEELGPESFKNPLAGLPIGPPGPIKGTQYAIERYPLLSPLKVPCTRPPWGKLVAVDLLSGAIKWSTTLGTLEKLMPLPIPLKFGTPTIGGAIITAGGLVFIGATADEKFRAFDLMTGQQLWQEALPTSAMATPMTYEINERQFVVIAAGGHLAYYPSGISDQLVAFALPTKTN